MFAMVVFFCFERLYLFYKRTVYRLFPEYRSYISLVWWELSSFRLFGLCYIRFLNLSVERFLLHVYRCLYTFNRVVVISNTFTFSFSADVSVDISFSVCHFWKPFLNFCKFGSVWQLFIHFTTSVTPFDC